MRIAFAGKSLAVLLVSLGGANAISLTNRDPSDQKIVLIEGEKQSERVLKAGEKVALCESSCVIRLPGGEDYEFDGPETVSLEEGLLFLENESDAQQPGGDAGAPATQAGPAGK